MEDLPLIDLTLKDLELVDSLKIVSHYWNDTTDWKMDALDGMLPSYILDKLGTILVRLNEERHDGTCWGLSDDGKFSLKSAYNMLMTQTNTSLDGIWSLIWKLKVPPKIQMFVWLLYHEKILTNEETMRSRMTNDPRCHSCRDETKDLDHLFRTCRDVRLILQESYSGSQESHS